MVVTSLYTRNMLLTTLFPGYDNLVKPCHKLVSLYKVVTSCLKTLHKFEINCCKTCVFFAVVVVTRYLHVTCMLHFWQQACNMFPGQYRHATCTLCATCCCLLCACCMHVVYELLIHVAICYALPYNYNIFMTRACPV